MAIEQLFGHDEISRPGVPALARVSYMGLGNPSNNLEPRVLPRSCLVSDVLPPTPALEDVLGSAEHLTVLIPASLAKKPISGCMQSAS